MTSLEAASCSLRDEFSVSGIYGFRLRLERHQYASARKTYSSARKEGNLPLLGLMNLAGKEHLAYLAEEESERVLKLFPVWRLYADNRLKNA
jgi:hypothetical protein